MCSVTAFSLSRSTRIDADPARVHDLVDDFRQWVQWSPWEGLDPDLNREYDGPARGVGSRYAWRGNSKAGEGSMEIIESDPTKVLVDLQFIKPFKATNLTRFDLAPDNGGTDVTWTMTGERKPLLMSSASCSSTRRSARTSTADSPSLSLAESHSSSGFTSRPSGFVWLRADRAGDGPPLPPGVHGWGRDGYAAAHRAH